MVSALRANGGYILNKKQHIATKNYAPPIALRLPVIPPFTTYFANMGGGKIKHSAMRNNHQILLVICQ